MSSQSSCRHINITYSRIYLSNLEANLLGLYICECHLNGLLGIHYPSCHKTVKPDTHKPTYRELRTPYDSNVYIDLNDMHLLTITYKGVRIKSAVPK